MSFWRVAGLNSYVRSLPAAAARKLQKTRALAVEQLPQLRRTHHPETTEKPPPPQPLQQSPSRLEATSSEVVRCSQCGGIDYVVVNGVERQLKGDVICACGYDPELTRRSEGDLDAAVAYPTDDDLLASTSTPY